MRMKICIVLAIHGICIKIEKLRVGKRSMCICISQWHIVDVGTSSSLSISGWCKWRSGERWLRFGCGMAVSVKWSYIHSVAPPVCLQIFCHAILVRKAAMCEAFMNHSWVSFHCSLHLSVPRKLNSPLPLLLDFGARFLEQVLHLLSCGAWIPSFGHVGHIQRTAHVRSF